MAKLKNTIINEKPLVPIQKRSEDDALAVLGKCRRVRKDLGVLLLNEGYMRELSQKEMHAVRRYLTFS